MKIELCEEFFYRVNNEKLDFEQEFNSCKENILRNNENLKFYCGEWIKIKVNKYSRQKALWQRGWRCECVIFCKLSKNEREIKKKVYYNIIIYTKKLAVDHIFTGTCLHV